MNRLWLFLFLFGVPTIIGVFLTMFWAQLAALRIQSISHRWWHDRAAVLAAAIAIVAAGVTLITGARVIDNAEYGLSTFLSQRSAYLLGSGLALLIIGFLKMTWLADLERHPPKWTWLRVMLGLTVLWGVICALLLPGLPLHG